MATIKDVALQAGVSTTTVSHTLNGTRYVDPDTQARVWAAVQELRYRPNSLARGLRRRESKTLGLIMPDNANPFFADLARAIEDAVFEQGYSVILCNSDRSVEKEAAYIDLLLARQVDGLFVVAAGSDADALRQALLAGVPIVTIPGEEHDLPIDTVMSNEEQAGRLAAEYLLGLGHRCIGCIAGPRETSASAGRVIAFRAALAEEGIDLPANRVMRGDFRPESGRDAMAALLAQSPELTAVFAANDAMAIGALSAIQSSGRRVPGDISVIGFDGIWLGAVSSPPLTTIAPRLSDVAETAVGFLRDRIGNPSLAPRRVLAPVHLVERASCRQPEVTPGPERNGAERRSESTLVSNER